MRRGVRIRALWLAAFAVLTATFAAAPAEAARWRVSGTISGTYANSIGKDTPCPASFEQRTTLAVKLRPRLVTEYRRDLNGFAAPMRVSIAGNWSLSGSYSPISESDGSSCEPAKPVTCAGKVIGGSSRFERQRLARIVFTRVRGRLVASFDEMTPMSEDADYRPELDPACNGGESRSSTRPVFALGGGIGTITARNFRFAHGRALGRRAFTVTGPTQRRQGCTPSSYLTTYDRCTEQLEHQGAPPLHPGSHEALTPAIAVVGRPPLVAAAGLVEAFLAALDRLFVALAAARR